ncbi:MAG: TcpQ domain-containing protein [Alphaproteobacteria bacterium]|nr:TcpQ domain-containing protein [Alphaproteobacteria bacterium]
MPDPALFPRPFTLGLLVLTFCVLAMSSPALAGFQWVAPGGSGTEAQEPLQPLIIQAPPSAPVTRAPQTLQLPQEPQDTAGPLILSGKPAREDQLLVPPASETPSKASSGQDKPVRGFANNVPLAVALRQLLPPEYGFSVSQNVKLSVLVSWQGGRPWRPTLEDMLRSAGLAMHEQGKMINIVQSTTASAETEHMLAPPVSAVPSLQPMEESRPVSLAPPEISRPIQQEPVLMAPQAPVQTASPSQSSTVDSWTAKEGETLHKVLDKWCRRAGVDLNWQAEYDYPVQASISLTGTFEEAVRTLLTGFEAAQPQPVADLHNSPAAGQSVLIVQARGNNYND